MQATYERTKTNGRKLPQRGTPRVSPVAIVAVEPEGFKNVHDAAGQVRKAAGKLGELVAKHYKGSVTTSAQKDREADVATILTGLTYILQATGVESAGVQGLLFSDIN